MDEHSTDNLSQQNQPVQKRGGFWSEIIKFTLITLLIVVPFRLYVAQPFIVSGASMDPTFADGDYLIVDQLSKEFIEPSRDSVVIFKYPKDQTKYFIKRIIGLPGDTVEIRDGIVFINGKTSNEPFIADDNKKDDNMAEITLNPGEYFVLGDNRKGSLDSRSWGTVPQNLIVGRPIVRLLPVPRFNVLPGDYSHN